MSDLADLAEALTKDLPIAARKVIDKALETGWELNKPGMTVVLRLSHPTDDMAQPIYVSWSVKKTPTGKVGFSFDGCSTAGLVPLRPAEILDYLEDPSVILETPEELEARHQDWLDRQRPKWDENIPAEVNVANVIGDRLAPIAGIERNGKGRSNKEGLTAAEIIARSKARQQMAERGEMPSKASAGAAQSIQPGLSTLRVPRQQSGQGEVDSPLHQGTSDQLAAALREAKARPAARPLQVRPLFSSPTSGKSS